MQWYCPQETCCNYCWAQNNIGEYWIPSKLNLMILTIMPCFFAFLWFHDAQNLQFLPNLPKPQFTPLAFMVTGSCTFLDNKTLYVCTIGFFLVHVVSSMDTAALCVYQQCMVGSSDTIPCGIIICCDVCVCVCMYACACMRACMWNQINAHTCTVVRIPRLQVTSAGTQHLTEYSIVT